MSDTYSDDFYAWAERQAALLRARRFVEADIERIAEEIVNLGRSEKRELVDRLAVLLHLLKWRFQPGFRSPSRNSSIREQRVRLRNHLADNPSLKAKLDDAYREAYELAAIGAARETGVREDIFPAKPPFDWAQATGAECGPD